MPAKETAAVARRLLAMKGVAVGDAAVRRAVSTAYYALFHLLTEAACGLYLSADSPAVAVLRRTFDHEPLTVVSGMFSKGKVPKLFHEATSHLVISEELKMIAKAFVELRVEREKADYDFSFTFQREVATQLVKTAEKAIEAWEQVKDTDTARLYLASFLLHKTWNQDPRGVPSKRPDNTEGNPS